MWVGTPGRDDELFAKMLIDEWLRAEREISRIRINAQPDYPNCPPLLRPYADFVLRQNRLKGYIRRVDGQVLHIEIGDLMIHLYTENM
ncbi:unnamed protein product, partial [Mesorhabditis spiculigera]